MGTTDPLLFSKRVAAQQTYAVGSEATTLMENSRIRASVAPATGIVIPVNFHVLRSGYAVKQGNVPDSVIASQIKVGPCESCGSCPVH